MARKTIIFQDKDTPYWLDESVFTDLFNRYWQKLFAFCHHHIKDVEASKEIVQYVFLSLWERREKLDIRVNIGHYLFSAVRLKIARYLRNRYYENRFQTCMSENFCDSANHTEETVLFADLKHYVETLLNRLPCRCREVYHLSRNKGLSIPEISRELGIAEKTTETHLTKALKFLREEIKSNQ